MRGWSIRPLAVLLLLSVVLPVAACGGTSLVRSAGKGLGEAANARQAADDLQRLQNGDEVERALGDAFCDGVTTVAQDGELPNEADWASFLQDQVESQVFDVSPDVVEDKVEQFVAAANLTQINSGLAARYVQACGRRF